MQRRGAAHDGGASGAGHATFLPERQRRVTPATTGSSGPSAARVLVLSMYFAPCAEVGGKRFMYLSRHLRAWCGDYHVLARREKVSQTDTATFDGKVHRVSMLPHYPPTRVRGVIHGKLIQAWVRWFCLVDPFVGWIIPATLSGIRLCRRHRLNVVVATVPSFAALIAGAFIARFCGTRLIIDYRDPWTNRRQKFPVPFGRTLCTLGERAAIRRASAIVFCTDVMREEFDKAFGDIAPSRREVIYNGFADFENATITSPLGRRTTMVYAGTLYGSRRLEVIAPVLAEMLAAGEITPSTFRFNLYTERTPRDHALIDRLGLGTIIQVHEPVSYDLIKRIMRASDILFLPSGDDVPYAVPYKFFDYLSVRRPILAVAPRASGVGRLMESVDCGELAEFGNAHQIRQKLGMLLRGERRYTFDGAERFRWENAARKYISVIDDVIARESPAEGQVGN
jgi:glycosyltransferase involved in cell wall biosynthesis